MHSFMGGFKFIGFKIDKYKVIFVGLGQESMNIWGVRFDFDRPHIFVGYMAYIHWLTDEYKEPTNIRGTGLTGTAQLYLTVNR
jgi:hypothetical protein